MLDDGLNVPPSEHPETVMSFDAKLDVASLEVKISPISAVFVEAPLDTALDVITIVGAVLS